MSCVFFFFFGRLSFPFLLGVGKVVVFCFLGGFFGVG